MAVFPYSTVLRAVAQCMCFEAESIRINSCNRCTTLSRVLCMIGLNHSHLLERGSTQVHPIMTCHTTTGQEQLPALKLKISERLIITPEPMVKRSIWGHQGLLKHGNCIGNLIDAEVLGPVDHLESLDILGNRFEHLDRKLMGESHLKRVLNRAAGLLL